MNELDQKIADTIYKHYDLFEREAQSFEGGWSSLEHFRFRQREILTAMTKEIAEAIAGEVARRVIEKVIGELRP